MRVAFQGTMIACALTAALLAPPLLAAETVELVATEYPPYTSQALPGGGVLTTICVEAFKRAGYKANVTFFPWARALSDAKEGRFGGILGIWHTTEREQWFVYSRPLPANQIGFYRRSNDQIAYKKLTDLKNYAVGIVRGYANPKAFDDAKLNTEAAVDDETNLRKLASNHIDLALIDKGVGQFLLDRKLPGIKDKLSWMEPAIDSPLQYLAFPRKSPNHEKTLAAFNQGLKEMEKDGSLAGLVRKAGI